MVFVEFSETRIFSSNPANGAQNVNQDQNEFDIYLNEPISIPRNAINCTLEVVKAQVWYVQPNISEEIKNNQLEFVHNATTYNWTIPDGLYSLPDLNAYLSRQFVAEGLDADLFDFAAENSTQKVVLTFNYAGTRINFTAANSVNTLLGFNAIYYPLLVPSVAGESFTSQSTAALNRLETYLIHCSLVPNGIPINENGSNIIADIPISVDYSPGDLIVFAPFNPIKTSTPNLVGQPIGNVHMRISDQEDRAIEMLGEYWSVTVTIRYMLQVADHKDRGMSTSMARAHSDW